MIEFDKAAGEVRDKFREYAIIARERILQGESIIHREFQKAIDRIRSGDYTAKNIVKHCSLAIASAALSIFTPEIAIAFTVVAVMSVAAKVIKQHKPYVSALVGLTAGVVGFTVGQHFAEATFVATWHVLREFTNDVYEKIGERMKKTKLEEAVAVEPGS